MKVYVLLKKYDGGAEYGCGASVVGVFTCGIAAENARAAQAATVDSAVYSYEFEVEEHVVQ